MATYFVDNFSSLTGWTKRWNTTPTWTGANPLVIPGGVTNDWTGLTLNAVDSDSDTDDVEVLVQFRLRSGISGLQRFLVARGAGADESATHVHLSVGPSSHSIGYCSGSDSRVNIQTFSTSYSTANTYQARMRLNGSALKTRVWDSSGGEPGTWDIEVTEGAVTGAGWVGFAANAAAAYIEIDWIGVGTNGDTAPSSATSSGSAITAAAGAASASTLTGAATFAAGITSAAGSATASTISGSATFSASFTAADGAATAGTLTGVTLTGGSTITAAAGSSTAGTLSGSAVAASAITAAAGVATAGTLAGASIAEAGFTPAAGESTAGTLVGVELSGSQIGIAAGSASASTLVGFSVAQAAFVAADGVGTGETLTYPDAPAEEAAKSGGAYLYSGFVKARKRLALQRLVKYLTQPEIDEETKRIIREVKQGKPIPEDAKPPVVMPEVSAEKLADKLIPARVAEVQALADVELQAVIRKAIRMAQERDDEDVLLLL